MNRKKDARLLELKRSNYEVVKGDPDIRGWTVKDVEGRRIGKVEELILDTAHRKVRYMVVDLKKNEFSLKDREVLIPIGMAEIHRKDDDVILPEIQASQLELLPDYDRDHLNGDVERKICSTLGRKMNKPEVEGMDPEPEFYTHDYFNDDNLYRHRLREGSENKKLSEYEKGLRLWEKRSEGGIIPDSTSSVSAERNERIETRERLETREGVREERRSLQPVKRERKPTSEPRNRKDRASGSGSPRYRPGKSIEDRIRREGLRDPGEEMGE